MSWSNGTDGWSAGTWIAMAGMMLLVWALIAALVIYVVRSIRSPASPPTSSPTAEVSARAILDERFARGEIDADEYSPRRDVLARR